MYYNYIEPSEPISARFRQYVRERKFELKDYAALGLKKVLVTSSVGCRRKVTLSPHLQASYTLHI